MAEEEPKPGIIARQVGPVVQEAAETVREGLKKTRLDFFTGVVVGFTLLMALQSIYGDEYE